MEEDIASSPTNCQNRFNELFVVHREKGQLDVPDYIVWVRWLELTFSPACLALFIDTDYIMLHHIESVITLNIVPAR